MCSPAPKSPELSYKNKKYDRQLRLWGEHGQHLLENSNVCLINANALGCEILKGLVLPGIGGFTIVDGRTVAEEDIGVNFFLETSSIGSSRAVCCMELIQELNSDVRGDCVSESVESVLMNRPEFFGTFDVVFASNLSIKTLLIVARQLWDKNVPFFYCRSVGLYGSVRLQIQEHTVIESHPDNRRYDLRLENPFKTLYEHLQHAKITPKVPWLIILYKYLEEWRNKNGRKLPTSYKDKNEIRDLIRAGMSSDEENFEEAIKAVNTAFGGGQVPLKLKNIFDDDCCSNLNIKSGSFWILAKCLKDFIKEDNNGMLPVPGVLPDMTADTESYIALQNIYRAQSINDADNVHRRVKSVLKELGLPDDTITEQTVRIFCREAVDLTVMRGSKIEDEYENPSRVISLVDRLEVPSFLVDQYIALRALERFETEYGYLPGVTNVEVDTAKIKLIAAKLLVECGIQSQINEDLLHEVCRYGGCEIHTVSAFMGGCIAQEVIKVITKQYVPIENTFLYNAITSETSTLKL